MSFVQPLVAEDELANRLRELVALPQALEAPRAVAHSFRRGSMCGLEPIGGRTEFVRGDVCDGRGLAGRAPGVPCCPAQVSGRGACMPAAVRAWDIVISPRTQARACSIAWRDRGSSGPSRLEQVKDVLRARCRPQGEELVIRIGEGPTAADRYETRVTVFREDHNAHLLLASVQHVTHAPWVPSGRSGTIGSYCGDVGGPSRHRPGGPSCG